IVLAFDAQLPVSRQDLDADGVADLPEMLIPAAEDGELLGMAVKTDGDFWHARLLPVASSQYASPFRWTPRRPVSRSDPGRLMIRNRSRSRKPQVPRRAASRARRARRRSQERPTKRPCARNRA